MTEYDTEQSSLEQRISELETATERISTKAVQIDKFVRLGEYPKVCVNLQTDVR